MYELLMSLFNGEVIDRLFSFSRRMVTRLLRRLKRSSIRAIRKILETAQQTLCWLRRIGGILGRAVMRPFQPIREALRAIIESSQQRLKPVGSARLITKGKRTSKLNMIVPPMFIPRQAR